VCPLAAAGTGEWLDGLPGQIIRIESEQATATETIAAGMREELSNLKQDVTKLKEMRARQGQGTLSVITPPVKKRQKSGRRLL
jgi:hypothetical protein